MWEMASKQNFLVCWGSPGRMSSRQVKVNTCAHGHHDNMAERGHFILIFLIMESLNTEVQKKGILATAVPTT